MKYLKLFENHNDYYTQINSTEFDRLNLEPFTKNELEFIYDNKGKLSMNAYDGVWRESSWFGHKFKKFFIKNFKYISLFSPFNSGSIEICKSSDEWYYVEYVGNFYKCDQLDGLIDCIQYCISLNKFKPKIAK